MVFGGLAFFLAVAFLSVKKMMVDEAGNMARITEYGFGYWLWLLSIGAALGAAILRDREQRYYRNQ
jgi:hypothetical protein